jgi:hypothetical protein
MIRTFTTLLVISLLILSNGYADDIKISRNEYIDCMECFTNYTLLSEENGLLEDNIKIQSNYIELQESEHNTEVWYYRIGSGILTILLLISLL